MPRKYVLIAEVADHLSITERTVRRYMAEGTFTGYRLGRRLIRLRLNEVEGALRKTPNE